MKEKDNYTTLNAYKISKRVANIIFIIPIITTLIIAFLLTFSPTRTFGFWLLDENSPIEILTFIFLLVGGIFGIYSSINLSKHIKIYIIIFYLFFSICLVLIAMEEIAWGQWFFHFETPEKWKEMNLQEETTIHNLKGFHGHNEILRFLFGLGGLLGILLNHFNKLKDISVPKILFSWFLIIFFHSLLDILTNMDSNNSAMQRISELIEMLIGVSAFLYLWLNFRMIRKNLSA